MLSYSRAQWYVDLMDPMAEALNQLDVNRFNELHARALAIISAEEMDRDMADAIDMVVSYLGFLRHVAFREAGKAELEYPLARERLLRRTHGPESDLTRRRYYLQLRIIADNMKLEPLQISEFRCLFSDLDFHEMHTEQWYFASNFAFRHNDIETISRAYEQFLLYRDEHDNELFQWVRLSVMYRLLRQEAQPRHVEKLLLSIRTSANAREVRALLLPEIKRQQLMTAELEALLERTMDQLDMAR